MRDQRNAGGPEARIFGGAGNFLAEFRRELAVHGRAMHADFLEYAAVHHRHDAAAARLRRYGRCAARACARSGRPLRASGAPAAGRPPAPRAPRKCRRASASNQARARALRSAISGSLAHRASVIARSAACISLPTAGLPQRLAGRHRRGHRDIERAQALAHRDAQPRVGRLVHRLRHAGAFAAEQQHVAVPERESR